MTPASFLAYSAALGIAAAIPGPGVTALVARALGSGFRSSFTMLIGLLLGDLFYLTAAVLGLAFVAQQFGMVFTVIKWFGVLYLAWLGWRFWREGITPENIEAGRARGGLLSSFLGGLTLTLGNPKTMVFYLAITPTVIDLNSITLSDYVVLALITAVVLTVVLLPYLVLASRARWFLSSPRALKMLNRTAATFMVGAAAAIAARH
ncbi:LysE family translocator [Aquamicrobium defluvii]|uniref:Threonine/homoserine/homoserine lactone efflux protein n=1 Tax=Aquamicrobium defluvii TaxID=69279 RepID=A0A4R6YCC8_9HYPH|nr:LysE family translocator [Aquamicrobium defluvii]TDR33355.1 threonine/homoserine/homoserine lactone efflux protein [Aquamicrobium defluvii]